MQTLVNIVGAGRLGQTLARLLANHPAYRIGGVLCRSMEKAAAAVAFIGAGLPCCQLVELPGAPLTLLAVPDGQIATVAAQLAEQGLFAPEALVFHASGAGELELLTPLAERGVRIGSLHPAYSFADPERAAADFAGTLCAVDGSDAVYTELGRLAQALGGRPFRLAPGGKAAYHASLSVASNFLVTLTDFALRLASQAGVPVDLQTALVGPLMRQTLDNVLALDPEVALTGPIVRGDAGTVASHLSVLTKPMDEAAYRALAVLTLQLAQPRLRKDQLQTLAQVLHADKTQD